MKISFANSTRAFLGAILFFVAAISASYAKDLDLGALKAAAETGDPAAQRELGEALLFGIDGVEQDKVTGLQLLEQSAAGGDVAAKASFGKALLDGHYLPANHEKGAQMLEEAAAAGSPRAQVTLGVALLWGTHLEADPLRARSLLGQAAGNGDPEALRILGEQLIGGWVFDRDVASGRLMLEKAVVAGDAKAKVVLGLFLLDGAHLEQDSARALALFEEAALSGNGEGLERYGKMLMWSERDPVAAESYLRRAGELGSGSAWTTLAEGAMYGYLGRRSRAKFDGFSENARIAGDDRIEVLEAERQMWGISMRASGPRTIEGLEQAAEAGNKVALKYLISLVRNGNRLNIRQNPEQAKAYLEQFSDLLTPTEIAQFSMTIEVAKMRNTKVYKALAADFDRHPELKSVWYGKELYAANPNFAIYLLQVDMKRNGVYAGALNGLATRSTLHAIWGECQTIREKSQCGDTVLHPDVIGELLAR